MLKDDLSSTNKAQAIKVKITCRFYVFNEFLDVLLTLFLFQLMKMCRGIPSCYNYSLSRERKSIYFWPCLSRKAVHFLPWDECISHSPA